MSQTNSGRQPIPTHSERVPRRIVLLTGSDGEIEKVLAEYHGAEVSGKRVHADFQKLAREHRGRRIAAEWLGPRGWVRFLWAAPDA
jgi:hypothetical protein